MLNTLGKFNLIVVQVGISCSGQDRIEFAHEVAKVHGRQVANALLSRCGRLDIT